MKKFLLSISNSDLVLLGFAPVFLYGLGYMATGKQIFFPNQQPEGKQIEVISSIESENVSGLTELKKGEEEREKEKNKRDSKDQKRIKTVSEIKGSYNLITDINSKEKAVIPSVEKVIVEPEQKNEVVPTYRKKNIAVHQQPAKEPIVIEEKQLETDPYANFKWSGKKKTTSRSESNFIKKKVAATFLKNGTFTVDKDKTIQIINEEPMYLEDGNVIPENTVMKGFVRVSSDRMNIHVASVTTKSKHFDVNIDVYDESGGKGLYQRQFGEMAKEMNSELDDIINNTSKKIGIPTPLGKIELPTRKRNNKVEIFTSTANRFYIKEK